MTTRRWLVVRLLAVATLVAAALASWTAVRGGPPARAVLDEPGLALVDRLGSGPDRVRDGAIDDLLRRRSELVRALILRVSPASGGGYPGEGRAAAAYLLGQMRAEEAVPALVAAMDDRRLPENRPDRLRSDRNRLVSAVWGALVHIGRPAVPALIARIEASDDADLRVNSLRILAHVLGGGGRVLELLKRLEARSEDPEVIRRLGECRKVVEVKEWDKDAVLY